MLVVIWIYFKVTVVKVAWYGTKTIKSEGKPCFQNHAGSFVNPYQKKKGTFITTSYHPPKLILGAH